MEIDKKNDVLSRFFIIAIPIVIQGLISNSLNFVDVLMIGRMGEMSINAVGITAQVHFLFSIVVGSLSVAVATFIAQYWGAGQKSKIDQVTNFGLALTLGIGLFFGALVLLIPTQIISLYTPNTEIAYLGRQYMRIVGYAFPAVAMSLVLSAVLRSIGSSWIPMVVSILALGTNTTLNYLLISGELGFPALGVEGAAIATLISRMMEILFLVVFVFHKKIKAFGIRTLVNLEKGFVPKYLGVAVPNVLSGLVWAGGIMIYNWVYSQIGDESFAAVNIAFTIEGIAFVLFGGIVHTMGIIVGNKIGEGRKDEAFRYGWVIFLWDIGLSILMGMAIYHLGTASLALYSEVDPQVLILAEKILLAMALVHPIKVANMTLIVGGLNSGGDTRFTFFTGLISMWVFGVPMALVAAFVLRLPVYWVIFFLTAEEAAKLIFTIHRYRSKKWIRDLVQEGEPITPDPIPPVVPKVSLGDL